MNTAAGVNPDTDRRTNLIRFGAEAAIMIFAIGYPLTGNIGWDFAEAYRAETLSGSYGHVTYNPWPLYWLIYPFAILPLIWGAVLWNVVQAIGYVFALRRLGGSAWWFVLSLPCFWNFSQGQIEGFMAIGLALALTASPLWAGLGLTLISLKPQFAILVIAYILIFQRHEWQLLIFPIATYASSFIYWGFWIDDWLATLPGLAFGGIGESINYGLYPYALVLIPLLFIFRDLRIWSIIQGLCLPYFAFYSFAPFLAMKWHSRWAKPYVTITSWIVFLAADRYSLVRLMPLVMLIMLVLEIRTHLGVKTSRPVSDMSSLPLE